jgi:ubiquinone/menaquinone biosynthesis C-methylase UbiE
MDETKPLYGSGDFVGLFLCQWRLRAIYPLIRGKKLLDVGCGDNRLVRKNGKGTGIDITPYTNVDRVCKDFSELPFQDGEFEAVTIIAALNYFDRPVEVLREIRRVLKPDGRLYIALLNEKVSELWHRVKEKEITPRPAYSENKLKELLARSGLRIEKRKYFMFGVNCVYIIRPDPDPTLEPGI